MIQLASVEQYLNSLLPPDEFSDYGINGLQVDSGKPVLSKIGLAVDAGMSIFEQAAEQDCGLLIVHHGIIWGENPLAITDIFGKKVRYLIEKGLSLYASHLPLDANKEVGNNYELARFLDLEDITSFFEYQGGELGAKGTLKKPISISTITSKLTEIPGATTQTLFPFGKEEIRHVAIISGSASDAIPLVAKERVEGGEQIDLFITGEPKQEAYHIAKEHELTVLCAGHYATETFGVRALGKRLEADFDIETVFIDEPTGV